LGFLALFLPIKAPDNDIGTTMRVSMRDFVSVTPDDGRGNADMAKIITAERTPAIKPEIIPASESFEAEKPPIKDPRYSAQSDKGVVIESGSSIELEIAQKIRSKTREENRKIP